MNKVSQQEYNKVIKTIEQKSCYKFSAGTDDSGAFMIPVASNNVPMATPIYFTWSKLKKLAELVKNKPKI
jgi:hypothetical protein